MTTTVLNITNRTPGYPFNYIPDMAMFAFNSQKFLNPVFEVIPDDSVDYHNTNAMFFDSSDHKVILTLNNGPCHFFRDFLATFLEAYEQYPKSMFILDISNMFEFDDLFLNEFLNRLTQLGVNFITIKPKLNSMIYIKNFTFAQDYIHVINYSEKIFNFFKYLIDDIDHIPNKKVYVSRSGLFGGDRDKFHNFKPGASFNHDSRILNEKVLQEYLVGHGFDIVIPENFKTFKDQVNTFYNAKTILSVTSGGLTNQLFMKPGSTVIELTNSMIVSLGGDAVRSEEPVDYEEALHHYYVDMAWNKGHVYVSIPNKQRTPESIIDLINVNPFIKKVIEE